MFSGTPLGSEPPGRSLAKIDHRSKLWQRSSMRQVRTLNVSLTPELREFVAARVASGRFGSASEVVRAALRAFERQEAEQVAATAAKLGKAGS